MIVSSKQHNLKPKTKTFTESLSDVTSTSDRDSVPELVLNISEKNRQIILL